MHLDADGGLSIFTDLYVIVHLWFLVGKHDFCVVLKVYSPISSAPLTVHQSKDIPTSTTCHQISVSQQTPSIILSGNNTQRTCLYVYVLYCAIRSR